MHQSRHTTSDWYNSPIWCRSLDCRMERFFKLLLDPLRFLQKTIPVDLVIEPGALNKACGENQLVEWNEKRLKICLCGSNFFSKDMLTVIYTGWSKNHYAPAIKLNFIFFSYLSPSRTLFTSVNCVYAKLQNPLFLRSCSFWTNIQMSSQTYSWTLSSLAEQDL